MVTTGTGSFSPRCQVPVEREYIIFLYKDDRSPFLVFAASCTAYANGINTRLTSVSQNVVACVEYNAICFSLFSGAVAKSDSGVFVCKLPVKNWLELEWKNRKDYLLVVPKDMIRLMLT